MSTHINKITITEFECLICKEKIVFDINNPETYLKNTGMEEFFSMVLSRYVVSHLRRNEDHINVIIVDQDGKYRGHKDSYINYMESAIQHQTFQFEKIPLFSHNIFDIFLEIDFKTKSIYEYINKVNIKDLTLAEKLLDFIRANKEIHQKLPQNLVFNFVNKNFYLTETSDEKFLCVLYSNTSDNQKNLLQKALSYSALLLNNSQLNSPTNDLFKVILKIIGLPNFIEDDLPLIKSIAENESFFTKLKFDKEHKKNLPKFVKKYKREFFCFDFVLDQLFRENISIIEIFQKGYQDYRCILNVIEFLQRQRVLIPE